MGAFVNFNPYDTAYIIILHKILAWKEETYSSIPKHLYCRNKF